MHEVVAVILAAALLLLAGCSDQNTNSMQTEAPAVTMQTEAPEVEQMQETVTEEADVMYLCTVKTQTMANGTVWQYEYTYDNNGFLLESSFLKDQKAQAAISYTCDENGKVTREVNSNLMGSVSHTTHYSYDETGNLTIKELTWAVGGRTLRTEYFYDASGREIQRHSYTNDIPAECCVTTYLPDGSAAECIQYEDDVQKIRTVLEFDADKNLISEKLYRDGEEPYRVTQYNYDAHGNRIHSVTTDGNGSLEYEYDYQYRGFVPGTGFTELD